MHIEGVITPWHHPLFFQHLVGISATTILHENHRRSIFHALVTSIRQSTHCLFYFPRRLSRSAIKKKDNPEVKRARNSIVVCKRRQWESFVSESDLLACVLLCCLSAVPLSVFSSLSVLFVTFYLYLPHIKMSPLIILSSFWSDRNNYLTGSTIFCWSYSSFPALQLWTFCNSVDSIVQHTQTRSSALFPKRSVITLISGIIVRISWIWESSALSRGL